MDKEWLKFSRLTPEYRQGAIKFVERAKSFAGNRDKIVCPCKICQNQCFQFTNMVYEHLVINGMEPMYTTWVLHGEQSSVSVQHEDNKNSETFRMYRDACFDEDMFMDLDQEMGDENLKQKVEDGESPLYEGCVKYTKLSAVVVLFKHKTTNGWSDKSFDGLLEILRDLLPPSIGLPDSLYSSKKLLKVFNLGYEKIDACSNDCCLFRKDFKDLQECPKCGLSRWKKNEKTGLIEEGVSAKVLRYFPIIPRLKRMFRSPEVAKDLTWHHTHRSRDGKMRHPVDSLAWETIDSTWPSFASDPRNLRLGLSTDGFNPFSIQGSRYSCWPVVLVTYNLPPWKCMSQENLMLTLLIPGPKQPGNDIDIYLQPLIEDLNELWVKGVEVYDASNNSVFNLRSILMWTISDFPAYGNLAGCKVKGELACPLCGENTCSLRLKFCKKNVYMAHRRFLPINHKVRYKRMSFDETDELREKPRILTGEEVRRACSKVENDWGKKVKEVKKGGKGKKRKRTARKGKGMWKKRSIFFDLPYWEKLCLRHNLDVMHIEKNICESIVGTLLQLKEKTKDGINCRKDLENLGIRPDLHVNAENESELPHAPYLLKKEEKEVFIERLLNIRLPDGYSSNIANCVVPAESKLVGLKSHDCHVLIQQLLSVAIRGLLPKGTRIAIFRLCAFFNELCQRVIDKSRLEAFEDEVVETLCMLEMCFPPLFFDIMVHLTIHLAREARLCGPVQYRWMYPFERFMKVLKGYVRNRARPEGFIAECYLADECMKFCSNYIKEAIHIGDRPNRNEDYEHDSIVEGHPISKGMRMIMPSNWLQIAHRYILFNSSAVESYTRMHLKELIGLDASLEYMPDLLYKKHTDRFISWFRAKVINEAETSYVSNTVRRLALGPMTQVMSYASYVINGKRYRIEATEKSTQDSGVSHEADTVCTSSVGDTSQVVQKVVYYGVLKAICVVDYYTLRIPLFKCDWVNSSNGVKVEEGFTLVNFRQRTKQFARDPFILASQAKQVFYSRDNDKSNWYVVLKAPPRGFHDLEKFEESAYTTYMPLDVSSLDCNTRDDGED